jgi:hypothetical protein
VLLASCGEASEVIRAADEIQFEVRETAGIRRRNDVITARLPADMVESDGERFRLLRMGEPVAAQVRSVGPPGGASEWVIDFIDHFAPFETRRYAVEVIDNDSAQRAPAEPAGGLELAETAEAYTITSGGVVRWTIRKDLGGLLDFSWKDTDYVANDSTGLLYVSSDGVRRQLAERPPTRSMIERSGPIACALQFEFEDRPRGATSRVLLEFVRTKSWVHAVWTIDGDPQACAEFGAALQLELDGPESLLDFGAGDFVYATVTSEQSARLEAGPRAADHLPWQVLHGPREQMAPIVVAHEEHATPRVHGWAHVMDGRRCTALAIGHFGESSADAITVDGRGDLIWTRKAGALSAGGSPSQRLEFWLHFVTMPVHIGARTSPRSMQEPLEVRWIVE